MAKKESKPAMRPARSAKAKAPLRPVAAPPRVRRRRVRAHGIMRGQTIIENPTQLEQRAPLVRKANRRLA